ncbi:lysylphosphatidylglycerol synthase domain-containing protein [Microbacterium resistens]
MGDATPAVAAPGARSGGARPPRTAMRVVRMVLTWTAVAAVFVAAGFAVRANGRAVTAALGSYEPVHVALAGVVVLAGILCSALGWHALLDSLGTRVRFRRAAPLYFVGMLGKYVPGSVWAYVLQIALARRAGIRRTQTLATTLANVAVVAVSGLAVGILTIPELSGQPAYRPYLWLFVFVPVIVVLLIPAVFNRLLLLALRLVRVAPPDAVLRLVPLLRAAGWSALGYGLFGLHLWLLLPPHAADGSALLLCIGSMGLAMIASLVFFILPAGLGAREAVIVAVLAPAVGTGAALAAALVSRLLFTVGDLALAGGALGVGAVLRGRARREGATGRVSIPASPATSARTPLDEVSVVPPAREEA